MNRTAARCGVLLLSCGLTACTGEEPTTTEAGSAESTTPSNRIDIPPTVRSNLGITFASVERRAIESTLRLPGVFELQPLARHEYRLTLPGQVELLVDQYQPVRAGDGLYRLRSPRWPELQHEVIEAEQAIESAAGKIAVAEARLDEARTTLASTRQRVEALAQADFRQADLEARAAELDASLPRLQAEIRQAQTDRTNAEQMLAHALHHAAAATGLDEAALREPVEHEGQVVPGYRAIDAIEVRALEPGVVETLAVTNGGYAEAPALVVSTVDPRKLRFRAMGLQSDLPRFTSDLSARIVPPVLAGVPIGDAIAADVVLGLEAHPDQRTVTVLATPHETRPWARPGVSAFLEVVVDQTGAAALAIPRAAVVRDGITHVFFRRDPQNPNQAIRVEADLGIDDGRWVVVQSGVSANDEVVLDGVYELKLATQQSGTAQKGGHFHADGSYHGEH